MLPSLRLSVLVFSAALTVLSGCAFVPKAQLLASRSTNRALVEQCRAQLAEIENLKIHSRNTAEQLKRTEEDLALLESQLGLDRKQLANYQRERENLHQNFMGLVNGKANVSPAVRGQLAEIAKKYPNLHFDPQTGIAKLDTDILFDSGTVDLKGEAQHVLGELAKAMSSPEAQDLKVLVVGHTDDRRVAKMPGREKYANNFHLSTARALTVGDQLRQLGLSSQRVGIAGFGPHQPIAPNVTPTDRAKNRRVEIFVMVPDVPVVGWTETIPTVY